MRQPPSISSFPRYPITAGTILLACIASGWYWTGHPIDLMTASPLIRYGEIWRLITCTLPHTNVLHLAFNAYWLWTFGTLVEEAAGPVRTLALTLLLALGSSAAEFAFLSGGIGLSGVGYGYFGLLWILSRHDRRFKDAVDPQTIGLFVVWFFVCVVTTMTGMMAVGNIAHGVGCLLGMLIGLAVNWTSIRRNAIMAAVGLITTVLVLAAAIGRPYINLSRNGSEEGRIGYADLLADRNERASRWLQEATRINSADSGNWFNLGIAYQRLGRTGNAAEAYKHAAELDPNREDFKQAYESMRPNLK